MKVSTKLTSIKLIEEIYKDFKYKTVNSKMNLQKLVNRSMNLYILDNAYKTKLDDTTNLSISGSVF